MTNNIINPVAIQNGILNYNGTDKFILSLRDSLKKWGRLTDKQMKYASRSLKMSTSAPTPNPVNVVTLKPDEIAKINSLMSNNKFVDDIKSQIARKPQLSQRQYDGIMKWVKNAAPGPKKAALIMNDLIIEPTDVVFSRYQSKRIKKQCGLSFTPVTMTITKLVSQTDKALTLVGRLTLGTVTRCRICGKDLTDDKSRATGIGPVCCKRLGIPYIKNPADIARFMSDLKATIDKIGDLTFTVYKNQIEEGEMELRAACKLAKEKNK